MVGARASSALLACSGDGLGCLVCVDVKARLVMVGVVYALHLGLVWLVLACQGSSSSTVQASTLTVRKHAWLNVSLEPIYYSPGLVMV